MQKLKQPKAKLFYFLQQLEKKGTLSTSDKGILKDEIIKDNKEILNTVIIAKLKQRELKKNLVEILTKLKISVSFQEEEKQPQTEKIQEIIKEPIIENIQTLDNEEIENCKQFEQKCKEEVFEKLRLLQKESPSSLLSGQLKQQDRKLESPNMIQSETSSPNSHKHSLNQKRPQKQLKVPENRQMHYYQEQVDEKSKIDTQFKKCQSMQLKDLLASDQQLSQDKQNMSFRFKQRPKSRNFTYYANQIQSMDQLNVETIDMTNNLFHLQPIQADQQDKTQLIKNIEEINPKELQDLINGPSKDDSPPAITRMETQTLAQNVIQIGRFQDYLNFNERIQEKEEKDEDFVFQMKQEQ